MKHFVLISLWFFSIHVFGQYDTIMIQPNAELGKDAMITDKWPNANHGDWPEIAASIWTHLGNPVTYRTLLDFNLSELPPYSTIIKATLTLWVYGDPTNWNGDPLQGNNTFTIHRITQQWDEYLVTWTNTPTYDNLYMVLVPQVSHPTTSISVDVTDLITDRYENPQNNFGMIFKLVNEINYSLFIASFASSDHTDPNMWPQLEIIFNPNTSIENYQQEEFSISVSPNPVKDILYVSSEINLESTEIQIYDVSGRIWIHSSIEGQHSQINIEDLPAGNYILKIQTSEQTLSKKFIRE